MKNLIKIFMLAACAMPSVLLAETIPYSNTFETANFYGESIFANSSYSNTWTSDGQATAIITNIVYSNSLNTVFIPYPIDPAVAPHASVLSFTDGTLTNAADGTGQPLVYVDLMVQPTLQATEDLASASALAGSQFAVAFTTNGVAVWHGVQSTDWVTDTQRWDVLNAPSGSTPVSSGKWCRLTISLNYQIDYDGFGSYNPMFQVKIDGQPLTSPFGYVGPSRTNATNGSWLPMTSFAYAQMSALILKGNGKIDDLVVNTSSTTDYVTPTNFVPYGWLTFTGVVTNGAPESVLNAAEYGDADGDGMLNWQEFIAGTDPTNSASKFMIVSQVVSNGKPYVSWLSSVNARAPYRIESSTNLSNGTWVDQAATTANGTGTNVWAPPTAPTNRATFYRLQIR